MQYQIARLSAGKLALAIRRAIPSLLATVAIISVSAGAAGSAKAGWIGDTLGWQYYAYGGAYNFGGSPGSCTITKKTDCGKFFRDFKILVSAKSITFSYRPSGSGGTWSTSVLSLAPTIYNGVAINLTSSNSVIKSVTIDPKTNMSGFDSSRLGFTGNQIQVDWQNLSYNSQTIVKLDVTTKTVPSLHVPSFTDNPPKP